MKNFTVTMPFAGAMIATVEAKNEKEAIDKFYEKVTNCGFKSDELDKVDAEVEWEFYQSMGRGNVRSYQYDEVEVQQNFDDGE